ncbi:MAG: VWA domain-containing protein, partial [Pyrinomonadaceae bacterium]
MRKIALFIVVAILILSSSQQFLAQTPIYDDPIRVNTDVVSVPVTVLNKDGRYVTDLTKDNFKIIENGIEQ